jgi:hypothetical protein
MRWAMHVACMREKRNTCRVLVGKPERRKLLGRTMLKLEGNIEMDFKGII